METVLENEMEANNNYVYAKFWERLIAYLLDSLLLLMVGFLVLNVFSKEAIEKLGELIGFLYFVLFESSAKMATPGKQIMGIKVIKPNGSKMSFWNSFGRTWAKVLSTLILLVGWVMPFWTKKKQALHDMIANTIVVKS